MTNLSAKDYSGVSGNSNESSTNAPQPSQSTLPAVRTKEELEQFAGRLMTLGSEAIKAEGNRRKAKMENLPHSPCR